MIIAVDFDGVICAHRFPEIGEPNLAIINKLIEMKGFGNKIILWTCREGRPLTEALEWCKKQGLVFDAVNENVPELKNKDFAFRKIYADVYLDDRNLTLGEFYTYCGG